MVLAMEVFRCVHCRVQLGRQNDGFWYMLADCSLRMPFLIRKSLVIHAFELETRLGTGRSETQSRGRG